jgi:hypothetical protein
MHRTLLVAIALLVIAGSALAQEKSRETSLRRDAVAAPGTTVSQTPEMWFYEQERSHWENPREAVRRKAEYRAAQRSSRIASMRWYGMSNARPSANATPITSTYSPTWTSNSFDPFRWTTARDTSSTTVIVR